MTTFDSCLTAKHIAGQTNCR